MVEAIIHYASDSRGVYIPQYFAESVKREYVTGISSEQYAELLAGPDDNSAYWDTWDFALNDAVITINGIVYRLYQDGDLWCVCDALMSDTEYDEFFGEPRDDIPNGVPLSDVDEFVNGYCECAVWSSVTDDDETPEQYRITDDSEVSPDARGSMRADCIDFIDNNLDDIRAAIDGTQWGFLQPQYDYAQAGHDFWLTRNGHGAGFWDRGMGELGDRLSDAARAYGSNDLYVGDDGLVYVQ